MTNTFEMLYICNIKPPKHGQDGSGNTNKSAPRPEQGRREIRRGGPYNPSRGAPAKAPRRGGPLASPRTSRYTARARPEHGRFPGQAALRKPPGTHRRTRPAPKMHRSITRTSPLERDVTNPGKKRTLTSLETNTLFICKTFRHLNGFGCVHALFDSCYRVISSHIP